MTDKQALFFQELQIIQEQAVNMNIHQSDLTKEELLFNVIYDTMVMKMDLSVMFQINTKMQPIKKNYQL